SPPLLEAIAQQCLCDGRPGSRDDDVHQPDRPARVDVQRAHQPHYRAHAGADPDLRAVRGALGAAAGAHRLAAARAVAVRRRTPAPARRMTLPGSALQRAAQLVPPDPLLSVVMPVFNERDTIEEIIHRVLAVKMRIELIV